MTEMTEQVATTVVNRTARIFKAQFIEVYVGTEIFADTNVIVAIYLQATDRLYEVVFINRDTAEEISRLYVYEDELTEQMNKRHEALSQTLTLARNAAEEDILLRTTNMASMTTKPSSSSSSSLLHDTSLSTLVKRKASTISAVAALERGNRNSKTQSIGMLPLLSPARRRSFDTMPSSSAVTDNASVIGRGRAKRSKTFGGRQTSQSSLLAGSSSSSAAHNLIASTVVLSEVSEEQKELQQQKDEELLLFIHHKPQSKQPSIRCPLEYFKLQRPSLTSDHRPHEKKATATATAAGVVATTALSKVEQKELLTDRSLLDSDISACSVQDISFFTAVILTSLYVRHKARKDAGPELQFLLFDVGSQQFFCMLEQLPPTATLVDGVALVARLNSTGYWKTSLNTDNKKELVAVQNLLESASGFHEQSHSDLHMWGKEDSLSSLEENINPNKHPYRYMWQAAYTAVVKDIRARKKTRSVWQRVIDMKKQSNAREAFLVEQGQRGKFRTLRVRPEATCSVESNYNYKSALSAKMKNRDRGKDADQGKGPGPVKGKRQLSRVVLTPSSSSNNSNNCSSSSSSDVMTKVKRQCISVA